MKAALALALAVVRVAGLNGQNCESDNAALVDFSTAFVSQGIVSTSVVADFATVNIYAAAVLPNGESTNAELYNTSASTGVDTELDMAELGNAVIIQEDNAAVPNNRVGGGTLVFTFEASKIGTQVELVSFTILDIKSSYTTVETTHHTTSTLIFVPAGGDGSIQVIDALQVPLSTLMVHFNESGAIAEFLLCIDAPRTINEDPHLHTHDSNKVDIYLPVGQWVPLIASADTILKGHVFSKADDLTVQWFDGIVLEHCGHIIFNATIPHNVKAGEVNVPDGIAHFDVHLDGQRLFNTDHTYTSANGVVNVTATKISEVTHMGIYNDRIVVETPDFAFSIVNRKETNKELIGSVDKQLSFTHLNLEFPNIDPFKLHGPLIELISKNMKPFAADRAWRRKRTVKSRVDPAI